MLLQHSCTSGSMISLSAACRSRPVDVPAWPAAELLAWCCYTMVPLAELRSPGVNARQVKDCCMRRQLPRASSKETNVQALEACLIGASHLCTLCDASLGGRGMLLHCRAGRLEQSPQALHASADAEQAAACVGHIRELDEALCDEVPEQPRKRAKTRHSPAQGRGDCARGTGYGGAQGYGESGARQPAQMAAKARQDAKDQHVAEALNKLQRCLDLAIGMVCP